jgi:uncharacterized protein (DUF433 family)
LFLNLGETKSVAPRFLEKAGIFEFLHLQRRMNMSEKLIVSDPAVMMGKPVIKGTRITVELILEKLGAGETIEQILDAHPRLTREAIQAALSFAAKTLRSDVVYPIDEAAV